MDKHIFFLGSLFPLEIQKEIVDNSKAGIQNASNLLQWDYIKGIEENIDSPVNIITRMSIGMYPRHYKKAIIRPKSFSHRKGAKDEILGFWNAVPVRPFFFTKVGIHKVLKILGKCSGDVTVIGYSYSMARMLYCIKRKYKNIKTVLILPDLPRYTDMAHPKSILYQLKHHQEELDLNMAVRTVDLFVPITHYMSEALNYYDSEREIVIDGMVERRERTKIQRNQELFTIAYTGNLTKAYGIMELINAISDMPDSKVRLIICGKGEAEQEVKDASVKDQRIQYLGMVSAREAHLVQCKSNLLINPRKNEGEYTKYSFPSKILQYMSSGTPVLCYKLDGMSREYDDLLIYIKEEETLQQAIVRTMKMSQNELTSIGERAFQYVMSEKTNVAQTKRLLDKMYSKRQ